MEHLGQFLQNHWQLCVAFVVISILILLNESLNQRKQGKSVSPEMAVDLINNKQAVVMDLRDAAAFKAGHIIGAMRVSENDFDTPRISKYKNKDIILVCVRGVQAASLASKLRTKEYTNPMVLSGGIEAWKQANLPLIKK